MSDSTHAPSPADTPAEKKTSVKSEIKPAPKFIWIIAGVVVVLAGILTFINMSPSPKTGKNMNAVQTVGDVNNLIQPDTTWKTYSLKKVGDSATIRIKYGFHIHTFSIHNKMYGCQYQGHTRQVIGNGVTYDPIPVNSRLVTISFEKDIEDIDCFIVKNGKCEYDDY